MQNILDRRWLLLFAFSLIGFIINVDYTAVNLALIPMANHLHADLNTIQWTLSGYLLGWALLVIPGGKCADLIDNKFLYLLGLSLFLAASLLAGLANSSAMLISARILQGIGGGIYVPTVYALIHSIFAEQERGRAIGFMSLGIGLGMALGPFIGGVLLSLWNWRSIFFINIPIGLVAWWIVYCDKAFQPEAAEAPVLRGTSGMILFGANIALILYLLSMWQNWLVHPVISLSLLAAIFIVAGLFIAGQRDANQRLFPAALWTHSAFVGCLVGISLEQFGFSAILVSSGLYLQKVLQYSALNSSLAYLFLSGIFGLIAVISGSWIDRVGLQKPTLIGFLILTFGSLAFTHLTAASPLWMLALIFFALGGGMGLAFAGLNTGIVKTVTAEYIGTASSLFLVCALMGNAFGVTVTTLVYQTTSLTALLKVISASILSPEQIQQLTQYIAAIGEQTPNLSLFSPSLQTLIISATGDALNFGAAHAMMINFLVSALAFLACGLLWRQSSSAASPDMANPSI